MSEPVPSIGKYFLGMWRTFPGRGRNFQALSLIIWERIRNKPTQRELPGNSHMWGRQTFFLLRNKYSITTDKSVSNKSHGSQNKLIHTGPHTQ